ncbi:MAG TPA: TIM barrel protein [Gemmataceae bacterium]|jgi:sugar phosphate isomerase/epimerase|nr:TIM barrel protein [Gemmataceae bacterium]
MLFIPRRRFLQSAAAAAAGLASGEPLSAQSPPVSAKTRKFQLGIVTYNVAKDWDLATILKNCQTAKIAAVELRTTHKHGVEPSLSAAARKDVKMQFADNGVLCWGCGSVCEFHSPDPAVVQKNIETCKQFVQLAADIGGRGVKVRPNDLPKGVPEDKTLEQIGRALIECGKAAADAGVEIWVEVHGRGTALPGNIKKIMDSCGHEKVGLTWNSNGTDLVKGSLAQVFALLKPWIRSCHINELYNDHLGIYPYRELFRLFREIDYDRVTLCEVGKTPPSPEYGAEFLKFYKALWHELSS